MRKLIVLYIGLLMVFELAYSQIVLKEPLSIRQTYYKIDAELNDSSKIINGNMNSFRVNKSSDIVPDVVCPYCSLYLNSYSSST